MTRTEKCSDCAEILTSVSLRFFKNLLPLAIFSYLALLKRCHIERKLIFLIYDSALLKNIFENNFLLFSLASQELIAVGIVKLPLTITELWQFFAKNFVKMVKMHCQKNSKTLQIFCILCYYITLSQYKSTNFLHIVLLYNIVSI